MDNKTRKPVKVPTLDMSASSLLKPVNAKTDRKVWSIGLSTWVPFFTATNATGETAIPSDVLGAPLRLAKTKDGLPKFSDKGSPIIRVARELSDQVRVVRENFAFGLLAYAQQVEAAMPEQYKAQQDNAAKAGGEVIAKEQQELRDYVAALRKADAEAKGAVNEAETITSGDQAPAPAGDNHTEANAEKELVPA